MQNINYQVFLIDANNNQYAELDYEDNNNFSANFSVADLLDLTKRKDPIVKNITFKGTKNNNRVLGNLSNLNRNVSSTIPSALFFNFSILTDLDCVVFENNSQIFKGKLHFTSCNRDSLGNINYEFSLKGYVIDLFSKINNKYLSDLDFTKFNHTYNIQNIRNSWYNTSGYVYPMIDYGSNPSNSTEFDIKLDYKNFRPAFYLKTYFDKIFTQPGLSGYTYTVTGSTFFNEVFNKIIIPNNDMDFSYSNSTVLLNAAKTKNPAQYTGANQTTRDTGNNRDLFNRLITYDTISGTTAGSINNVLTDGNKIEIKNTVNTTVSANVSFTSAQIDGTDVYVYFRALYRTASNLQFQSIAESSQRFNFGGGGAGIIQNNPAVTFKLDFTYEFQQGSQLAFVVYLEGKQVNNFSVNVLNSNVTIGSSTNASQVSLNLNDAAILLAQNSKSISQMEFLKSIIQYFNLYVYPSTVDNKHIIFQPYNDYYEYFKVDKIVQSAVDFTDKIDNSSFTITPVQDLFNLYFFKTKEDSTYYNNYYKTKYGSTYGDYQITGNTNSQDKNIEVLFASTAVPNYNGRSVPQLWELENNLKKKVVTVPRLLFYNGLKPTTTFEIGKVAKNNNGDYQFSSIDSANYSFGYYPEADEKTVTISDGQFIDLVFGQPNEILYNSGGFIGNYTTDNKTLFDHFYKNQVAELTNLNTKIIQVQANLNENDIQNLDLRKPVFISTEIGSNYFKILEVEYSNSTELAQLTLQSAYIQDDILPFSGYKSAIYAAVLAKKDCKNSGFQGSSSYYVVPEGKYTSFLSQVDADQMALNEVTTKGQTFANTNGTCVYTATTFNLKIGNSPTEASANNNTANYVTNMGNLNIGSTLYTYINQIPLLNYSAYYVTGEFYYHTDSQSIIIDSGTTASLSATTYDYYFVDSGSNYLSCQRASDGTMPYLNYQLSDPYPHSGTIVKLNDGITLVPDLWFSDGQYAYRTVAGTITDIVACTIRTGYDAPAPY